MKKMFLLLILVLFGFSLFGCNSKENEENDIKLSDRVFVKTETKENNEILADTTSTSEIVEEAYEEMIEFPINNYSSEMSSIPGLPIFLRHPDHEVFFECTINKGSFIKYYDIPTYSFKKDVSDEGIFWCPEEKVETDKKVYMDVVLRKKDSIVGYAVIEIIILEYTNTRFVPKILKACVFPTIDGDNQKISEEQIQLLIFKAKAENKLSNRLILKIESDENDEAPGDMETIIGIVEEKQQEMIEFLTTDYNELASPGLGLPILLKYPDKEVIFECTTNKGSLAEYYDDGPEDVKGELDEGIFWLPEKITETDKNAYIDVVLRKKDTIVGYAVIEIIIEKWEFRDALTSTFKLAFKPKLLKSCVFPLINGENQEITEEQLQLLICQAKTGIRLSDRVIVKVGAQESHEIPGNMETIRGIVEESYEEMIKFPIENYFFGMSSVPGLPIVFKHPDNEVIYECITDKGSFASFVNGYKYEGELSEGLFWCPEKTKESTKHAYIDIILRKKHDIIGYAVIEVVKEENTYRFTPRLLKACVFPKINGENQKISEEQINLLIYEVKFKN